MIRCRRHTLYTKLRNESNVAEVQIADSVSSGGRGDRRRIRHLDWQSLLRPQQGPIDAVFLPANCIQNANTGTM
jgi:hypothetical protein